MTRQIIIGTQGNQPFPIPDNYVGRRHAFLTIEPSGRCILVDNNSKNGTYIHNGSQFIRIEPKQQYPVTPDTMIKLGPQTQFHVRKLLPKAPQPPTPEPPKQKPQPKPKQVDISHLRRISDQYEDQKLRLDSKMGMINGLRGLTIVVTLAGSAVGTFFGGDDKVTVGVIALGSAVVLIGVLLFIINSYSKKLMRKKRDNENNYGVKYVCPECHVSFRGKFYENILAERCCPRCKTIYYDRTQQN